MIEPMILAVQGGEREAIQALLAQVARDMGARGLRVLGVVEHLPPGGAHADVLLLDLVSGETNRLHQDLGPGADGCSLDPAGLAAASAAVERAIALSHEKYCSASIMLGKTAQITTGFDLIEV